MTPQHRDVSGDESAPVSAAASVARDRARMFRIKNLREVERGEGNKRELVTIIDRESVCPYCTNDGWVSIQCHAGSRHKVNQQGEVVASWPVMMDFAVPCPMCFLGSQRDVAQQRASRDGRSWWDVQPDPGAVVFDGRLTIRHQVCGPCSALVDTPVLIPPGPCESCKHRRDRAADGAQQRRVPNVSLSQMP